LVDWLIGLIELILKIQPNQLYKLGMLRFRMGSSSNALPAPSAVQAMGLSAT
jgi:hypothetical protein